VIDQAKKIQGCLIGLAVGDALGGPAEGKTIEEVAKRFGKIIDFLSDDQGGSDDTEYALFNARLLLMHGDNLTADVIADAWLNDIASGRSDFKSAGFSEVMAIANLRRGIRPPLSGVHLHSWSDGLAMRVAPFGIYHAGLPRQAARLARLDGSVSHAGEGILAGELVAAAISMIIDGQSVSASVEQALRMIPSDSWTFRATNRAISIAERSPGVWEAMSPLYASLACTYNPWADLAPEAVALALGLAIASKGDFEDAVLAGANIGRDADTIAAIAGSVIGAEHGVDAIPGRWIERVQIIKGSCIASTAGIDVMEISQRLADVVNSRRSAS
jgi:ADP-ribosylglycohydrolase